MPIETHEIVLRATIGGGSADTQSKDNRDKTIAPTLSEDDIARLVTKVVQQSKNLKNER